MYKQWDLVLLFFTTAAQWSPEMKQSQVSILMAWRKKKKAEPYH